MRRTRVGLRAQSLVVALFAGVTTVALGCGGEPPAPEAPKRPPLSLTGAALTDADACNARKEHEKGCDGLNPANADVLAKVCLGERACLEELWEKEAVDRYMICRTRATCGADCKLEVARISPKSRAITDARAMCLNACPGKDGETLCDSVLQRFTPWKLTEQSIVWRRVSPAPVTASVPSPARRTAPSARWRSSGAASRRAWSTPASAKKT